MTKDNTSIVSKRDGAHGTWEPTSLDQLRRFMVLGVSGGTYAAGEAQLTKENAHAIMALIAEDGVAAVNEIVDFAENNRAPRAAPGLFALALCVVTGDLDTKKTAYAALHRVCSIPTHLFTFISYYEDLNRQINGKSGWGQGAKRAVARWYNTKSTKDLIYHVTKYKQREGWSHRDLLRLAHVKPVDHDHNLVYKFLTAGELEFKDSEVSDKIAFNRLLACDEIHAVEDLPTVLSMIREHNLVREHIPTQWLKATAVWEEMLPRMPLNALVRNLGKLTSLGMLTSNSDSTMVVLGKLSNKEAIAKSRLHPFIVLQAFTQYGQGKGLKGNLTWVPSKQILDGLSQLFYDCFEHVDPSGKRFYLGIDVSGSMSIYNVVGSESMKCSQAAAAMAMVLWRTEPFCEVMAFNHGVQPINISRDSRMEEVHKQIHRINAGGTDCSLAITDALKRKIPVDCFVIITDNDNNHHRADPMDCLRDYRQEMGIDARLISVCMTASRHTIADPNDVGCLDVIGFDASGPRIIRDFAMGAF